MKIKAFFGVLCVQILLFSSLIVPPAFSQKAGPGIKKYRVETLPFKNLTQQKYQLKLIHPYSYRLKTIQKSLVALKFKKKDIFNVKKGRIFNNDLVKRLAPLIQKQFTKASSNQRVAFKIFNASRSTYLEGDTFLTAEGLHWRFTTLRDIRWGIEDFSISGEPWVLVLQKGQTYKQRYWKGTQVAQDIVNWVILQNIPLSDSRRLPELPPTASSPNHKTSAKKPTAAVIKKRLHILEQLREDNAINDKEYARKRREILGQF